MPSSICANVATAVVEPYNTVLCVHSLLEHTDVTIMLYGIYWKPFLSVLLVIPMDLYVFVDIILQYGQIRRMECVCMDI